MNENSFVTPKGIIKYYVNEKLEGRPYVVFLPGLSADHSLFDKQVEYFEIAGHNSNTDRLEEVNSKIEEFINGIDEKN